MATEITMNYKKTTAGILAGTSMLVGGAVVDARIDPYTDVGTQKEIRAESVIPEAKTNRILADTTKPKITMEKFGGEVALGINYNKIKGKGNRPLFSKNIEWKQGNETMEMVPIEATTTMEDGGMEINIILAKKPDTNVFDFQLDNWESLDFFYQPALTSEEIAEGSSRPDNVIGSYAVYYKDHANHIEGQTNYATGKAYHIFRPLVTDADGATVWAEMNYANGVLTVTVPQSFLDGAAYPVKVDPTFGNTTVGGTDAAIGANIMRLIKGTVTSTGVVTSVSAHCKLNPTTAADDIKGFILGSTTLTIETNGSSPVAKCPSAYAWTDSTFTSAPTVVAAHDYYVGILGEVDGVNSTAGKLDSAASSNQQMSDVTNSYASPTNPTDAVNSTNRYSIYATYTVTGATIYGATLRGVTIY